MIAGEQVFLPEFQEGQNTINLKGQEYHHLIKVRRFEPGEQVWLVNGKGLSALATITSIQAESVDLKILTYKKDRGEPTKKIVLAIANLKGDHLNLVVEKATELGVQEIIPLLTERTIKKGVNLDRLNRVAVAAMKQSRRSRIPIIKEPMRYKDLIASGSEGISLFCHADEGNMELIKLQGLQTAEQIRVLIGPEGDWSKDEIDLARNSDYTFTGLGPRRLRAETAAIHAVGLVSALLQDSA